jgi:hypothetical protein
MIEVKMLGVIVFYLTFAIGLPPNLPLTLIQTFLYKRVNSINKDLDIVTFLI